MSVLSDRFDSAGNFLGGFQGGGIDGPWGITLDGDDNLWVANFGPIEPGTIFTAALPNWPASTRRATDSVTVSPPKLTTRSLPPAAPSPSTTTTPTAPANHPATSR